MNLAADVLRVLADETRLRLLRLLSADALNVSELTAILGVAQSGVSRHLGLLKKAGLVDEERTGPFAWYRLAPRSEQGAHEGLWAWLQQEFGRVTPKTKADDARLEEVRRLRKESFVTHGTERGQLVPGRSWMAWSRALGSLLPPLDVVDLGCGEGYLTIETARWARRVIAIDESPSVLERARAMATRQGVKNITWKHGRLERVPLHDASVDVVLLSQALHHAAEPARALAESARVLRPDGRVLILDLRTHEEAWVRAKLGDRWLGFDDDALRRLVAGAGLVEATVRIGTRRASDPFTVLVATGRKPRQGRSGRTTA